MIAEESEDTVWALRSRRVVLPAGIGPATVLVRGKKIAAVVGWEEVPTGIRVEEVESKDGSITVFAPPTEFFKAKTALLEAFPDLELEVQEITFLPKETKILSAEDLTMFEKFLGMLNDCDDVQEIYHNVTPA